MKLDDFLLKSVYIIGYLDSIRDLKGLSLEEVRQSSYFQKAKLSYDTHKNDMKGGMIEWLETCRNSIQNEE